MKRMVAMRVWRGLVLAAVGLGMSAGVWGCSTTAAPRPLNPQQFGSIQRQLDVASGQTFTLRLPADHSAGYRWELVEEPDARLVELAGTTYQAPSGRPGAVGYEIWTFRTTGEGIVQLPFRYVREGVEGTAAAAAARTASFQVFVLNEEGSPTYQQQRALRGATWNPDEGAGSFR